MKLTFLGQNCFLLVINGKTIITDPFYNFQKEKSGFDVSAQRIDFVLVTHAHGDHIADVPEVLKFHPNAVLLGQPEICAYFRHKNSIDFNIGGIIDINDLKITMVQALHTSSFPDGTYGGQPSGYLFHFDGKTVYMSGDTGLMTDMKLFPKVYGEISTAILCIGGHYTMDPADAVIAASEFLNCKKTIGCHFDTFPPITIDHSKALKIFSEKGVELILPKLGESFEI